MIDNNRKKLSFYTPLFILIIVELGLFFTNYIHGTYLMGWDNVMPEFNFKENLVRSIFGVWQEYRGLGLYDGMSHIALTLHTIFLWILSIFLPNSLLRYVFNIFMHFLGGLGMYLLIRYLFKKDSRLRGNDNYKANNTNTIKLDHSLENGNLIYQLISLIGALFYLFNPATIQMFFTPLESFSVHFAALPWIALTLINYLNKGNNKSLFWFLFTCILITPQYFITTLFFPILFVIFSILLIYLIRYKSWITVKKSLIILLTFFLINAFWLLPYIYGLYQNAPIIQNAKINLMSSNEVFLRNQAYGDPLNILLLRGFMMDFTDLGKNNVTTEIMQTWKDLLYSPIQTGISVVFAVLVILGLINCKKRKQLYPFTLIFGIGFLMLGSNTPLIKQLIEFIRINIPVFAEVFRFAFTKFSLLFVFAYSLFLTNGFIIFLNILKDIKVKQIFISILLILTIILSLPVFTGNFFYSQLKVSLPQEYLDLFKFMQVQDKDGRTAYLPQFQFWSWKYYQFGYRGSGFVWHGIPQPLLDQAFNPWSDKNENYYWEISQAIYQKNINLFKNVLQKYNIKYLIFDKNLISADNQKALYKDEIVEILGKIESISLLKTFNNISVYQFTNTNNNISLERNLVNVAPIYKFNDNDQAFIDWGDYYSANNTNTEVYYPFRSLFTKRNIAESEFNISQDDQTINVSSTTIPVSYINWNIVKPNNDYQISRFNNQLQVIIPKNSLIYDSSISSSLNVDNVNNFCNAFKNGKSESENITENNLNYLRFTTNNQRACLSFGLEDIYHKNAYILSVSSRHISGQPLKISIINETAKHIEQENYLPLTDVWTTSYFILPPLADDGTGYDIYFTNDAVGNFVTQNDVAQVQIYPLPYDFLKEIKLTANVIPNSFRDPVDEILKQDQDDSKNELISVSHPNPAYYEISYQPSAIRDQTTVVLNQSFNNGWKAYVLPECQISNFKCQIYSIFPFIFGKPLTNHVLVNNWANGWMIPDNKTGRPASPAGGQEDRKTGSQENRLTVLPSNNLTVSIIFLPQLLEYIGFGLLTIPLLYILLKSKS